jgi:lysosomal Pro-X carboxypeptidase
MYLPVLLSCLLVHHVYSIMTQRTFVPTQERNSNDIPPFETKWYTQTLDHFNWATTPATYNQRYLVNERYWSAKNGSLFFYCGNEGDIEMFYKNTGFMFDIAPQFNALIVFAEHRYYGKSLPFGKDSFTPKNIQYLSSQQALADFAVLLLDLRKNYGNVPIIAFGGSYGGMLAAWFRIKYPHIVQGAIASSAPVIQFEGLTPPDRFMKIITKTFNESLPKIGEQFYCADYIKKGFELYEKLSGDSQLITKIFKLCKPLSGYDYLKLRYFTETAIMYMAMIDYPTPADFLQPLPAWPVTYTCKKIKQIVTNSSEYALLDLLNAINNVYYNSSGKLSCFDLNQGISPDLGDSGWDYQACTEMIMPIGASASSDNMFLPNPWNLDAFLRECHSKWGVTGRPYWATTYYGGENIGAASNIVFSNGDLDPWMGGGIVKTISESVIAIIIENGAHHLDLRSASDKDPLSVIKARQLEVQHIKRWIDQYKRQK